MVSRTWQNRCRTLVLLVAALGLGAVPDVAVARTHVVRHHYHSRTGWRPVIPPFDQAEAEAEVHEIAPYRTYPFYPLFPEAPPPYAYPYGAYPYGW